MQDRQVSFNSVVRGIDINYQFPIQEQACPDQLVGTLDQLRSDGAINLRAPSSTRQNQSAVILVLESPHTSEFRHAIGPAQGNTGRLIAKHALTVAGIEGKDHAPLILINAIQYMCSLGQSPSLYRDEVFTAVWHEFGRSDFIARLKATYRDGDLVVCACTKGARDTSRNSLRKLVYTAIVEAIPQKALILRRTHPSSWYSKKNRDFEWAIG